MDTPIKIKFVVPEADRTGLKLIYNTMDDSNTHHVRLRPDGMDHSMMTSRNFVKYHLPGVVDTLIAQHNNYNKNTPEFYDNPMYEAGKDALLYLRHSPNTPAPEKTKIERHLYSQAQLSNRIMQLTAHIRRLAGNKNPL